MEEEEEIEVDVDVIPSAELASVHVWSGVYSCYQDFPLLDSFTARRDVGGIWLVEGRTPVTSYGLWEVEAATGDGRPRDGRSRQVSVSCDNSPVVLTGDGATVRVWVATYDCFGSPPPLTAFAAAQESPHRWVVEGRIDLVDPEPLTILGSTLFGLWLVETTPAP